MSSNLIYGIGAHGPFVQPPSSATSANRRWEAENAARRTRADLIEWLIGRVELVAEMGGGRHIEGRGGALLTLAAYAAACDLLYAEAQPSETLALREAITQARRRVVAGA